MGTGLSDPWKVRRQRLLHWLAREPCPAEELLEFSLGLLEIQESLDRWALASGWGGQVAAPAGGHPTLRLDRLPVPELLPRLESFLQQVRPLATEVLAGVAATLAEAEPEVRGELLTTFLGRGDGGALARRLSWTPEQLEFFPRAFIQPIAEALAREDPAPVDGWKGSSCPRCGWPPLLAVLRDEPEIKGHRYLVCSLCTTWWTFRRSVCPRCGEAEAKKLLLRTSDAFPHLRIEECQSCRGYLKAVDLRKDGHAVPQIDELASVELDLWAGEQGLEKIQPNLLGL